NPLWPYLLVLVALFALIVNAPRRWERFARSESLSATLARNANQSAGPQTIYHYIAPEQRELRPVVAEYDLDDPKDRSASDSTSLSSREGATAIDADAPQASAIEPRPLLPPQPLPIGDLLAEEAPSDVAQRESALPIPTALLKQLDATAKHPGCGRFTSPIDSLLAKLTLASTDDTAALRIVSDLEQVAQDGDVLAEQLDNDEVKTAVRRLQYALVRRLDIWKQVVEQRSQPMAVATDELLAADYSSL